VRLVPRPGLEGAKLDYGLTSDWAIDRKVVPAWDLIRLIVTPTFLCSERFARTLCAIGATGFRAQLVPHIAPTGVHGRALYRLVVDGRIGVIPSTAGEGPLVIDATTASGDDVCVGEVDGDDQHGPVLVVRRTVYDALARALRPRTFGADPVRVRGSVPRAGTQGRLDRRPRRLRSATTIDHVLDAIERQRDRFGHELDPGVPDDDVVREAFADAGGRADEDAVRLFRRAGRLRLFASECQGDRVHALQTADVAHKPEVMGQDTVWLSRNVRRLPERWVCFATTGANMYWCVDPNGIVRGVGADGRRYGPDAPFAQWLRDQVTDLAWIARHRSKLGTWTQRLLIQWFS
jgi:hypothetical protein